MPIIGNSTVVSAPREEVFDALVDLRGELMWNPKVELMEKITDGPAGKRPGDKADIQRRQPVYPRYANRTNHLPTTVFGLKPSPRS